MTKIEILDESVLEELRPPEGEAAFGAMRTERGHLPLESMDLETRLVGLDFHSVLTQTFVNAFEVPLEATYIFPLPDRAGVTRLTMKVKDRVIEADLKERGQARRDYQVAIESGHRAAIAEEERPGVFTMRAGNIPPGESIAIQLELSGPLEVADGEVTFQFPLVVAPRYIPGTPLPGKSVGSGTSPDTDAVPDASRISPPVLLPGQPSPVRLGISVEIDPLGMPLGALRASLHQLEVEALEGGRRRVTLKNPGERLDRDFLLRYRIGNDCLATSLALHPDPEGARKRNGDGCFALTLLPPTLAENQTRPRDVVVVLDRSGSMGGWKMSTARRAAGRLLDTLTHHDRFGVVLFDNRLEVFQDSNQREVLLSASNRQRYRAMEFLSGATARGGTDMGPALDRAVSLFDARGQEGRDKILVFVTDGQVGNEDQLLWQVRRQAGDIRLFTIGIDRAVNVGFLRRLARPTGGSFELVESEDRLDEVMETLYRRIGSPVLTGVQLQGDLEVVAESWTPEKGRDVFPGVPAIFRGRFVGNSPKTVTVSGTLPDGKAFTQEIPCETRPDKVLEVAWARSRVQDLEHHYVTQGERDSKLAEAITQTSLDYGVLSRFTAFVAVDREEIVNEGGKGHKLNQAVEPASGWDMLNEGGCLNDEPAMDFEDAACFGAPPPPPRGQFPGAPMSPSPAICKTKARSSRPSRERVVSTPAPLGPLGILGQGLAKMFHKADRDHFDQEGTSDLFLAHFQRELESLIENAIKPLLKELDQVILRRLLRFLLADLEEILERALNEKRNRGEAHQEACEIFKLFQALEEEEQEPGNAKLTSLLERLKRALNPEETPPGGGGPEAERGNFWM
jgi:Ca-activated chloride channel family protein